MFRCPWCDYQGITDKALTAHLAAKRLCIKHGGLEKRSKDSPFSESAIDGREVPEDESALDDMVSIDHVSIESGLDADRIDLPVINLMKAFLESDDSDESPRSHIQGDEEEGGAVSVGQRREQITIEITCMLMENLPSRLLYLCTWFRIVLHSHCHESAGTILKKIAGIFSRYPRFTFRLESSKMKQLLDLPFPFLCLELGEKLTSFFQRKRVSRNAAMFHVVAALQSLGLKGATHTFKLSDGSVITNVLVLVGQYVADLEEQVSSL
jgi:hypothetical protein